VAWAARPYDAVVQCRFRSRRGNLLRFRLPQAVAFCTRFAWRSFLKGNAGPAEAHSPKLRDPSALVWLAESLDGRDSSPRLLPQRLQPVQAGMKRHPYSAEQRQQLAQGYFLG